MMILATFSHALIIARTYELAAKDVLTFQRPGQTTVRYICCDSLRSLAYNLRQYAFDKPISPATSHNVQAQRFNSVIRIRKFFEGERPRTLRITGLLRSVRGSRCVTFGVRNVLNVTL
jgi:hypothetical protein